MEQVWTGYWSLLAALHRAQEEGIDITTPAFYRDCDEDVLRRVFRSDQEEEMPLLEERMRVMREVGTVLCEVNKLGLRLSDGADGTSAEIRRLVCQSSRASRRLCTGLGRARRG